MTDTEQMLIPPHQKKFPVQAADGTKATRVGSSPRTQCHRSGRDVMWGGLRFEIGREENQTPRNASKE